MQIGNTSKVAGDVTKERFADLVLPLSKCFVGYARGGSCPYRLQRSLG